MSKTIWFALILLLFFAAGCSAPATPAHTPGSDDGHSAAEAHTVREITIEAGDLYFSPAEIEVVAGQPVRLILNNTGALEHDWSIDHIAVTAVHEDSVHSDDHVHHMAGHDPDLHIAAMAGEQGVLEFTPTEPGTYEITCTVAGHKEAGMVGRLVVVE